MHVPEPANINPMPNGDALADRVRREREQRGWSLARAGAAGGVTDETWRAYEKTGHLTPRMRAAVTEAFGWPPGWYEGPRLIGSPTGVPSADRGAVVVEASKFEDVTSSARAEHAQIIADVRALRDEMAEFRRLPDAIGELGTAMHVLAEEILARIAAIGDALGGQRGTSPP